MKRIFFLTLIICALTFSAQAQESRIGIKGGVNFTNMGSDMEDSFGESNMKTGFHAGLFANMKITQFFALQPEVLYSLQGAKFDVPVIDDDAKINLSYINVPVLAKVYLSENFNIHAGPYIGFLISNNAELDDATAEEALDDMYKTLDFGVAGGLEFETLSGVVVGARYNLGLADIRNDDDEDVDVIEENDFNIHNQNIQAYIGFMF